MRNAILVATLTAILLSCSDGGTPSIGSQQQSDLSTNQPNIQDPIAIETELDSILSKHQGRLQVNLTWAWAPDQGDTKRFEAFRSHNESRWFLEIHPSKVPPGTIYEQTQTSEEGGTVSEYLVFRGEEVVWWYDGRQDDFSEFKSPRVRRKKVSSLRLVVHDGEAGWIPLNKTDTMPLNGGLAIEIVLEDGSRRYW